MTRRRRKSVASGASAVVAKHQHSARVLQGPKEPLGKGEDGKGVLEITVAAHESAGTGRKVALPFTPPEGKKPIELWVR